MRGLNLLKAALGPGAIAPAPVLVDTGRPGGTSDPAVLAAIERLVGRVKGDPETAAAYFLPAGRFVDSSARYAQVIVATRHEYGALVVVFRFGLGQDLLGLYEFPQIEGWIPIFLFAMLFGLSMDYEVFLVSRMREERDESHDNERAVAIGLERTGQIITAAAVIMVAAFCGFTAGSIVGLQEFGGGLAVAILLDATIVRAVTVPALMAVMGRYNWWLPAGVARVVRVQASPLRAG